MILLFAYNWDAIPRLVKLGLILSVLITTHLVALRLFWNSARFSSIGEALTILGTMFFGGGIWLVAQIYHLDEHYPTAFLIWGMMRKKITLLAIFFQALVLLYMAGKREIIHYTGQRIFLRTAPMDPRDPFRGDFVHLQYEISQVPASYWRGTLAKQFSGGRLDRKHITVYAQLKQGESDLAELEGLTDIQPKAGLSLRGHIDRNYYSSSPVEVPVTYGLESYFVQQGKGLELERGRRQENIQWVSLNRGLKPSGLFISFPLQRNVRDFPMRIKSGMGI